MATFGKNRFPKEYQKGVGFKDNFRGRISNILHKNSEELVEILKSNNIELESKVFELGAGPARNLHYILEQYPNIKLYCNDLWPLSIDHMSDKVKDVINYYVGDSEDIINDKEIQRQVIDGLDLFLVSDHFMHLQYEKADNIINSILSIWKPKYIMLREVKKEYETPNHPRLFHKYDKFLKDYDLVHESTSVNAEEYFIWLLKKK
jgi:SAM-dependent methyltransferase